MLDSNLEHSKTKQKQKQLKKVSESDSSHLIFLKIGGTLESSHFVKTRTCKDSNLFKKKKWKTSSISGVPNLFALTGHFQKKNLPTGQIYFFYKKLHTNFQF